MTPHIVSPRKHRMSARLSWLAVVVVFTTNGVISAAAPVAASTIVTPPAAQGVAQAPTPAATHAFIVDMGSTAVTPQTIANGLKPYGLVYALIAAKIPVQWVIETGKPARLSPARSWTVRTSRTAARPYRAGPFVIPAAYYSAALPIVNTWRAKGVVVDEVDTAVNGPLDVPVYET